MGFIHSLDHPKKLANNSWPQNTMFENLEKSLIQHCEKSELRLHIDVKASFGVY